MELWNLEHGTLGTLSRGTFFRFSKISNLTPPGQFLTFLWPTLLKTAPFIFGRSKSLAFLDLEAHGVPLGPPFWIFKKYAFLRPWRTSDGFLFDKIAQNWPFYHFLKTTAIYFWAVKILSFLGFGSSLGVARASFLNFSKIYIFASVTDVRRFSFLIKSPEIDLFDLLS